MIYYLARKYFTHSFIFLIALIIFPISFFDDHIYFVSRGFFWGGLFGGFYTYYDFKKKKIWPVFDNLQYSKTLLIAGLFLCFQMIFLLLKPLI